MATTTRADDRVRVTVPDSFVVADTPPAGDGPAESHDRRRARGPVTVPDGGAAGQAALDAALLTALNSQELELVDTIPIEPDPNAPQRLGRARRADRTFTIDVDIAPHEDAVLLLEQDGMYSWVFQSKAKTTTHRQSRGAPHNLAQLPQHAAALEALLEVLLQRDPVGVLQLAVQVVG